MIEATCPKCKKAYKLQDALAGRKAKCVCGATMLVPAIATVTPPPAMLSDTASSPATTDTSASLPADDRSLGVSPDLYDAFLDPTTLSLVKRQLEPEILLMVCDAFPAAGSPVRVLALTPAKLTIFSLDRQPGRLAIGERRDLDIKDVDGATTMRSRPLGIGNEQVTMQLATRSSIESWTSEYSSLERIAAAIVALKAGRAVEPFLRTTDDLAAIRATQAKAAGRETPKVNLSKNPISQFISGLTDERVSGKTADSMARAVGGVILFAIAFFVVPQIWGMLSNASPSAAPSGSGTSTNDRRLSDYASLPSISVIGTAAPYASFSDWRVDGLKIVGTMRFTGSALFRARATIRNGATIVDQPSLQMGTVDGAPKGTPVEVSIFIGTRKTDDMTIELEVLGAP